MERFGQPLLIATAIGKLVLMLNNDYSDNNNGLFVPAVTWPLVGFSIASCVNTSEDDIPTNLRNYIYYGGIGVLASVATLASPGTQIFFEGLNNGWLKDVFTGTLLHEKHGIGYCTMVGFHTLYLLFQRRIYNLAFGPSVLC